jgi:environmental stress-induced protein Ves
LIHSFDTTLLPATPWKNGGGVTREIVCQPPGAGLDGFDWRVSIATIAASGRFSAFPGVDRMIMLLDGAGVRLHAADFEHRLDTAYVPFAFDGDTALHCELLGGISTDFNLMTRRSRLHADVRLLSAAGPIAPAAHGLVLALRGAWHLQSGADRLSCTAGSGVWWDAATSWQATPAATDALLIAVRLQALKLAPKD